MIISHFPGGEGGDAGVLDYNYTGLAEFVNEGAGNWILRFLTSGIFTTKVKRTVQIFVLGAGAGGGTTGSDGRGGGGSGYTKTAYAIDLEPGTKYVVTVGAGGTAGVQGGTSSFGDLLSAEGGKPGNGRTGGAGGSGGGEGGALGSTNGKNGGSDGSDGGYKTTVARGQNSTTREFGDADGKLYAGAGGGGSYGNSYKAGEGGEGGGGRGGGQYNGAVAAPENGVENTGSGGGGAQEGYTNAGSGGSGIVAIRNVRY